MTVAGAKKPKRAPELIERFIKQLNISSKAVRLYSDLSTMPQETAEVAVATLERILEEEATVELTVSRDGFLYEGEPVFPPTGPYAAFAREFYARNVAEIRFHAGCTAAEIVELLAVMNLQPVDIVAAGGLGAALWDRQVSQITVAEASTQIVDIDGPKPDQAPAAVPDDLAGEPWPPSRERLDSIVKGASAGRPRDRRLLVRIVSDATILRSCLSESATARGVAPTESELAGDIGALAHAIDFEVPGEREALFRSLAETSLEADPRLNRFALMQRLLADARRDDTVAQVVRTMSLDEVMEAMLDEIPDTDEARRGLIRAVRNLALISVGSSREAVLGQAQQAMVSRGMAPAQAAEIISEALPSKLSSSAVEQAPSSQSVEEVLKLLDLAPVSPATHAYDEEVAALRLEATRGLTDGDVMAALVTIATLETRPAQFAAIMRLLEDSLGLVVSEQEFEAAASAAEALAAASADPAIDAEHRQRMWDLLGVLAEPDALRSIATALRVHVSDSAEYAACRRLLAVLGPRTVSPLLEVLAEEKEMAARRSICELVSELAQDSVDEVGQRVSDHRWYLVRNVVMILGAIRDASAVPYLERTLRHEDHRVRRETIRSAAGIRAARSAEMLVAALTDTDASNVQLAARYLGLLNPPGAGRSLEQVARGEGFGNRDNAPRIEAIEALGRIGSIASVRTLEELARQRGLIGGRTRDIRTAATAALAAIRSGGGAS